MYDYEDSESPELNISQCTECVESQENTKIVGRFFKSIYSFELKFDEQRIL